MSKVMKFFLYTGLTCLGIGVCLLIIGIFDHGYQTVSNDGGGLHVGRTEIVNNQNVPHISNALKGTKKYQDIKSIYVNAGVNVHIKSGDVKQIEAKVDTRQHNNSGVQITKDKQRLNIVTKKLKKHNLSGGFWTQLKNGLNPTSSWYNNNNQINSSVVITVPRNMKLSQISQAKRGGALTLNGLNVDYINENDLSYDNNLYHVKSNHQIKLREVNEINDVSAPSLSINNYNNDFDIKNSRFDKRPSYIDFHDNDIGLFNNHWNNAKFIGSDGDVYFKNQTTNKQLSIKTDDGDIDGHIKPSDHNKIDAATTSDGDVSVYHQTSTKPIYNYKLRSSTGDITIKK